jgi:1-acyl-sn-glycerol-3-phosphate acyltransferase
MLKIPKLGDSVPQSRNIIRKFIGRTILLIYGWRINGNVHNSSKLVVALAPHTSNWDFISNMGTMLSMGILSKWFVAKEFYWWPFSVLLKFLGGIPVDRSVRQNLVDQMVSLINSNDQIILSIYPEGATKKNIHWKTGFWHIAKKTKLPIQLVGLDYKNRVTIFGPTIKVGNSVEKDLKEIQNFYKDFQPKYPHRFGGEYI